MDPWCHSLVERFTWYNHLQAAKRGAIVHIDEHKILLFTDRLHPALQGQDGSVKNFTYGMIPNLIPRPGTGPGNEAT